MPGSGSRDARRTDQYLDGLIEAGARGADSTPMDMDLDPAVAFAAGELRAGLVRVHPSFRFEEGLASRLAAAAAEMGGSPAALAVAPSAVPASPAAPTFSVPRRRVRRLAMVARVAPAHGPRRSCSPVRTGSYFRVRPACRCSARNSGVKS
jgi:hypothetical protein